MKCSRTACVIAPLTLTAFVSTAVADVVELKTGQRVEGTFEGANESAVRIEIGGQTVSFNREQVRAIYFGSAPTPSAGSPAAPSPVTQAIQALKDFDAMKGRLSLTEYQQRLQELQAVVNRGEAVDSPARDHLTKAKRFYGIATEFWKLAVRGAGTSVGEKSMNETHKVWDQAAEETKKAEEAMKGQPQ